MTITNERLDITGVRLIAHRGSSAAYPEHTRAAYQQAILDGADGIETDIQLTADGVPVCWHDATLDRTTDATGALGEHRLSQLKRLDLLRGQAIPASHGHPRRQLMTLPALLELARRAHRPLILAIELKTTGGPDLPLVDAVLRALDAAGWDATLGLLDSVQISLQCFDEATTRALLERVPAHLVMVLTAPHGEDDPASHGLVDEGSAHAGPWVDWMRRRPERIRQWLAEGTTVRAWTVDEMDDLAFCLRLGVREITTNRPAELRAAMTALALRGGVIPSGEPALQRA